MSGPREDPTFTRDELLGILDRYWRSTGVWDPMVNGSTTGRAMTKDEHWRHDLMVGQRMAISGLQHALADGRLREASRVAWSQAEPEPLAKLPGEGVVENDWRECCYAYIDSGKALIVEWLHADDAHDEAERQTLRETALDHMNVLASIIRGEYEFRETSGRCPWHYMDGVFGWQNYVAVMEAAKDPDFESRLGPIEVVPREAL